MHGVEGLSVVDASIMPLAPATHLDATVYAVAEKVSFLRIRDISARLTDFLLGGRFDQEQV